MAGARLVGLTKRYGATCALEGFGLDVADGELVVVVGPSGCGKSTLLRLIAGLETLSAGEIYLGERRIDALAPQERDVAMVFQSYALYPHMSVRQNVEFPLRMRGVGRSERRRRAEEVAALLEIDSLLDRRPAALSGGQRQRVALARALVREPALFLLDEPLSNLDARLRSSVRQYIRDVQRRLGVTTLYVTHDQTEAMTLGDRVVVLEGGRVQMVAPPLEAYARPANTFVASFLGSPGMNLVRGRLSGAGLDVGGQRLALPAEVAAALGDAPPEVIVGVRPEAFSIDPVEPPGLRLVVAGEAVERLGHETLATGRIGGEEVIARLPGGQGELRAGDVLAAPVSALHFFSVGDGRRLGP